MKILTKLEKTEFLEWKASMLSIKLLEKEIKILELQKIISDNNWKKNLDDKKIELDQQRKDFLEIKKQIEASHNIDLSNKTINEITCEVIELD